jgi:hypothetical protein
LAFWVLIPNDSVQTVTLTMDSTKDQVLRERVREAIEGGRLPGQRPPRMWAGRGTGAACAICGEQIRGNELEYEFEHARAGDAHVDLHVHLQCCSAWDLERNALRLRQAKP